MARFNSANIRENKLSGQRTLLRVMTHCLHSSCSAQWSMSTGLRFFISGILVFGVLLWSSRTEANPEGGQVVAGSATINRTTPSRIDVIQQTGKAIINWRSFDIKSSEHTNFQQPFASAVALNRVGGGVASMINGRLTANGRLFLINPNGVVFGKGSQVNVGSLVATTADIRNEDFLAGRYRFNIASDNLDAGVINRGVIHVAEGGAVVLAAPWVRNEGLIQGRLGQVALAGAKTFTLDFNGDGLLQFDVGSAVGEWPRGEDGTPVNALVSNPGTILADGGVVALTARAASDVVDRVINMDGVIQARAVNVKGGTIILSGGDEGIVGVSGTLYVSGLEAGQVGGTVKLLGEKVGLFDGARVDASGSAGGGEVLVGGNFQGKGPEPNAKRTYVDDNARIAADAIIEGDGGKVVIWADELTGFFGHISARGGSEAGDGGFVEVSGKDGLIFQGTADLSAKNGGIGTLLLDPQNINIVQDINNTQPGPNDNLLDDGEIRMDDPGVTFNISATALENLSANANIVLEATNNVTIVPLPPPKPPPTQPPGPILGQLIQNEINFQSTAAGAVTIKADADLNNVGNFTVNTPTTIVTKGGNVTIEAANFTGTDSLGVRTNGGQITIKSLGVQQDPNQPPNGEIPTGLFLFPDSSSASGTGGSITVEAMGNVNLIGRPLNVDSRGLSGGGTVTITSTNGGVNIGNVFSSSSAGEGGKVIIKAADNVFTGDLISSGSSRGGDVNLISTSAAIATSFATEGPPLNPINSSSTNGTGGSIIVTAAGNVSTGPLTSSGPLGAGAIEIMSTGGAVDIGNVNSSSAAGAGGHVNFAAATSLDVGGINASGTPSGNITLQGNEINLNGVANSVIAPGGDLILRPTTPQQNIVLGGLGNSELEGTTAILDLTASDLLTLAVPPTLGGPGGFQSITIGRDNGMGTISVGPGGVSFGNPISLTSPGGAIELGGPIQGPGLTASGATISLQDVTTTGNQSYTGAVTLNNSYSTGGGNFAVTGSAALGSDTTITTNGGAIVLNGPVNATLNSDSPETLALNAATGNITLQGNVGNSLALGALTASGANISLQDVTTTGDQSYAGAVTFNSSYSTGGGNFTVAGSAALGSDTSVTTAGGNIAFTNMTGGGNNLILNAGTAGNISAAAVTDVGALTISQSLGTNFSGEVTATTVNLVDTQNLITFDGRLAATTLITTSQPYGVALNGGGEIASATTFANTGGVTLGNDATDVMTIAGGLNTRAGLTTTAGAVRTSGQPIAMGALTLNGPTTLDTSNGGQANTGASINFDTILAGNNQALTLRAGDGALTLGNIGESAQLGRLDVSGTTISLQDVTTTGDQSYTGAVTFNSIYNTGGGNFAVTGSAALGSATTITTLNSIPGAAPNGNITFAGTIDGAQALTLQAGTGNVVFGGDVGVQTRLGSTIVEGAADITIGGRFIAGDVNFVYTGFLNSPQGSLDVTSLSVAPNARGASVFGTVAGASGPQAAPLVTGAFADPDFTINDCVIGIPCFSTVLLPPPAQPRSTPPEVIAGDPATFEPLDIPPIVVARPPEDTSLDDPTTTQFSNFGNEELWMGEDKSE